MPKKRQTFDVERAGKKGGRKKAHIPDALKDPDARKDMIPGFEFKKPSLRRVELLAAILDPEDCRTGDGKRAVESAFRYCLKAQYHYSKFMEEVNEDDSRILKEVASDDPGFLDVIGAGFAKEPDFPEVLELFFHQDVTSDSARIYLRSLAFSPSWRVDKTGPFLGQRLSEKTLKLQNKARNLSLSSRNVNTFLGKYWDARAEHLRGRGDGEAEGDKLLNWTEYKKRKSRNHEEYGLKLVEVHQNTLFMAFWGILKEQFRDLEPDEKIVFGNFS